MLASGVVQWVDDCEGFGHRPTDVIDGIADKLVRRAKAADLQNARVGGFGGLLRELELVLPLAAGFANGGELIDAAKRGLIVSGD